MTTPTASLQETYDQLSSLWESSEALVQGSLSTGSYQLALSHRKESIRLHRSMVEVGMRLGITTPYFTERTELYQATLGIKTFPLDPLIIQQT